jgi:hypothetical protein
MLLAGDRHEDRLLDGNRVQFVAIEHLALLETLDGQHVARGLVLGEEDLQPSSQAEYKGG